MLRDPKLDQYVQLKQTEDKNQLLIAGCEILQAVIYSIIDKYDTTKYYYEQTFLGSTIMAE